MNIRCSEVSVSSVSHAEVEIEIDGHDADEVIKDLLGEVSDQVFIDLFLDKIENLTFSKDELFKMLNVIDVDYAKEFYNIEDEDEDEEK